MSASSSKLVHEANNACSICSTKPPHKRRRLNEVDALHDVIAGGRILDPSERRRRLLSPGFPYGLVDSDAESSTDEEATTGAQKPTYVETVTGADMTADEQEGSAPSTKVDRGAACTCCTLAYRSQIKDCPATRHVVRQITSRRFGLGSNPRMCSESEDSIFRELAPLLGATAFSRMGTVIIRRDVLQPLDMSLGLLQIRVNDHANWSFDVRTRYDKTNCIVLAGLRILREAQNLNLGYKFLSIDEDSTREALYRGVRRICRSITVRVSNTRGPSVKTAEDREKVFQELQGTVFDSREDDMPWAEALYTWSMSNGADIIA